MSAAASKVVSARDEDPRFTNGLTTTMAPFIEEAQANGETFIRQPYELYSEENQESWRKLYSRMHDRWQKYANERFLEGIEKLCFNPDFVPHLEDVNKFLAPLTGFRAKGVSGYVSPYAFFDCLRKKEFPTTVTIRRSDKLDYLPEPDIFHDIAGHVPMHTDMDFAKTLVRFGEAAYFAAHMCGEMKDEDEKYRRLDSILKAMARFFWFTIEFGLMRSSDGKDIKVYGSGLLSSYSEIEHSVISPEVQRYPIQLEWVINQYFEIDSFQPLLFVVDSFDHLFSLVDQLEDWMKNGKLDNVAGGKPENSPEGIKSFVEAAK